VRFGEVVRESDDGMFWRRSEGRDLASKGVDVSESGVPFRPRDRDTIDVSLIGLSARGLLPEFFGADGVRDVVPREECFAAEEGPKLRRRDPLRLGDPSVATEDRLFETPDLVGEDVPSARDLKTSDPASVEETLRLPDHLRRDLEAKSGVFGRDVLDAVACSAVRSRDGLSGEKGSLPSVFWEGT